jgi:DNA-binding PadR family transcriptional regulator
MKVTIRPLTDFEQVLLGMLVDEPRSGYALRKLFTATPAGVYQPSAGSLYPALRRMERRGLLTVESAVSAGRRNRRVWHPTEAGLAAHLEWVRRPVQPDTVAADLCLHLMRFVMMESQVPAEDVRAFLVSLIDALEVFVGRVRAYLATDGARIGGRHPVLALRHGIEMHQASLDWARSALAELAGEGK